jgi:hypothetical protein
MRTLLSLLAAAFLSAAPANAVVFQYGGVDVGSNYVYDTLDGTEAYITNAPVTASATFTVFNPTKDGGYYPTEVDGSDFANATVHFPDEWSWLDPDVAGYDWLYGVDPFKTDIEVDHGKIVSFSHSVGINTWGEDMIGEITVSGTSSEWSFAPYGNGGFSATLNPGIVLPPQNLDFVTHGDLQHISWNYFSVDSLENVEVITVPEPAEWALMIAGFVALGYSMRSRKQMAGIEGPI